MIMLISLRTRVELFNELITYGHAWDQVDPKYEHDDDAHHPFAHIITVIWTLGSAKSENARAQ